MPLSLAKLTANKAPAVVDFGDGATLNLEYYPQRLTSAMLLRASLPADSAKMAALTSDEQLAALDSATDLLSELLASWDLTDGPDEESQAPVPVDREHIAALGIQVQWTIFGAIMSAQAADGSGKPQASENSASAPASDATS